MNSEGANTENAVSSGGRKIYSLLELSSSITSVINKNYKNNYWIKTEIAKLNYYSKTGHCYPDLVEKKDGLILAQMKSIIWANDFKMISDKFLKVTKTRLDEGISVLLFAGLTFHPVYGLSLIISDIEPSFSLGEMAREKMETIERLKKEFKFEKNKSLPLPLLPQNIAVISVESSKGYSDFINILSANDKNYKFHLSLFPAILQGDRAVPSIVTQLKKIKKSTQQFDMVSIIRGGGGDIGLNCYDNYELANEIACFSLPVITGIGHSTNETVSEMISHTNKITPTDVAYFIIGKFHDFEEKLNDCFSIISTYSLQLLSFQKNNLLEKTGIFKYASMNILHFFSTQIVKSSEQLNRETVSAFRRYEGALNQHASGLKYKPVSRLREEKNAMNNAVKELSSGVRQLLKNRTAELISAEYRMKLLDPENVLKRGYSISYHKEKIIRNIDKLKTGDEINTLVFGGKISSTVNAVEKRNEEISNDK